MIAGLDIGTTNCKLSVFDAGAPLVETSASYAASRAGGRHTLDADRVWDTVKRLFREAIAKEPRAANIRALAVSSLGEAAVPVDAAGRTLGEALLFWDASGKEEMERIVAALGEERIFARTGVIPDPMYTVCKIAWRQKHDPRCRDAKNFLLFEDFITFRLTGEKIVSYSLAGRTMGLDMRRRAWSEEIFNAAGVGTELMSRPAPSGTIAGSILPSVRRELGLAGETLVAVGGHDQMCVALGAGAVREGIASNGSGTVEALALTVPRDPHAERLFDGKYTLSLHADPDRLFTYSCNATGSLLLTWYVETFGDPADSGSFARFEAAAPKTPTSLVALPYIAGSGTPFMDLGVTGGIAGVTHATTKYDIYRALMEGLAFDLAHNIDNLARAGVAPTELRATGGGSLSRMWLQIKADVTGLPVRSLRNRQAGALGCMMLASTAAGLYGSLYEAADELVAADETFEPDPENHAFYLGRKERYLELFARTRDIVRQ